MNQFQRFFGPELCDANRGLNLNLCQQCGQHMKYDLIYDPNTEENICKVCLSARVELAKEYGESEKYSFVELTSEERAKADRDFNEFNFHQQATKN